MLSVADIFELVGGPAEMGRAIGVPTEHATQMKRRASIPVRYWPALLRAADERKLDIDHEKLTQAHTEKEALHDG